MIAIPEKWIVMPNKRIVIPDKTILFNNKKSMSSQNYKGNHLDELINHWLVKGDLHRLEHVVIAGQGERLIGRTSPNRVVQEILDLVPSYMSKIRAVHETVIRGNLNDVKSILNRKRFAFSCDHLGATALHLAVLHEHTDVVNYIITQFPETINGTDNLGRTALHYSAVIKDEEKQIYHTLESNGANPQIRDKIGKTAEHYKDNSGELTILQLLENYLIPYESRNSDSDNADVCKRPPPDRLAMCPVVAWKV